MTLLATLDSLTETPDFESLLDGAVALGIRATRFEGPSPEAIEHLLRAVLVLANDHAEANDLDSEKVLRTVSSTEGAEHGYRIAYAAEVGVSVDDLHRDLGWWPDEIPLFDGMPVSFIRRVARAEAAQDRATSAALREMAEARQNG